jgi:hypothetical protein
MKRLLSTFCILLITVLLSVAQSRETRTVSDFTKISYGISGKLLFRQGSPQRVELSGDKDLLEKIETKVEGDRLVIRREGRWLDWSWGDNDDVEVYITVPTLTGISVSGSGDAIGQNVIKSDEMALRVSGSGDLRIEIDVTGDVSANVSGSGDIEVKGRAGDFESGVSGSGKVLVASLEAQDCEFDISGSGRIEVKGTSRTVRVQISGSGKVIADRLTTEMCNVRISGSGDVSIHVREELDVTISGSGGVSYRGNPSHVNSHASGSGSVRKLPDNDMN